MSLRATVHSDPLRRTNLILSKWFVVLCVCAWHVAYMFWQCGQWVDWLIYWFLRKINRVLLRLLSIYGANDVQVLLIFRSLTKNEAHERDEKINLKTDDDDDDVGRKGIEFVKKKKLRKFGQWGHTIYFECRERQHRHLIHIHYWWIN